MSVNLEEIKTIYAEADCLVVKTRLVIYTLDALKSWQAKKPEFFVKRVYKQTEPDIGV